MKEKIIKLATGLQDELVAFRRDFHRHAETAWTEYRTASIVAKQLESYGYKVLIGEEVIDESAMMGVPSSEVLNKQFERAKAQGALPEYTNRMKDGKTGVVGILETGKAGPVVALRFDMDANDMNESREESHRPFKEGFSSVNDGAMHACGHDGHTAMGLGVAKLLMEIKGDLCGTIKLIFQCAEEGGRGAASFVAKGIADDVDYTFGFHLGFAADKNEQIICGTTGLLATSKFDAIFKGVPAHAGAKPEEGKSALLAAAAATMALQGIYRHSAGTTRINIGVLQAGTGRNVVPDHAVMKIETRGATSELDAFMKNEAVRMLNASAAMYDVQVELKTMGACISTESDPEMIELIKNAAKETGMFSDIKEIQYFGASEDFTFFMDRVQKKGGKASYFMFGTNIIAGHHNTKFDFDEQVLSKGVAVMALMVKALSDKK